MIGLYSIKWAAEAFTDGNGLFVFMLEPRFILVGTMLTLVSQIWHLQTWFHFNALFVIFLIHNEL